MLHQKKKLYPNDF